MSNMYSSISFNSLRAFLVGLSLMVGLTPTLLWAAGPTSAEYGVVLNLSGKQRMLTQKMSKEVMLVALSVDTAANVANLQKTSSLFDKTLKGLRNGSGELRLPATSSKRILRQLDKIDQIWAGFYPAVKEVISRGSASKAQVAQIAENQALMVMCFN